jgi:hypothetical protein
VTRWVPPQGKPCTSLCHPSVIVRLARQIRQSRGAQAFRGRSGLHRAGWRLTTARRVRWAQACRRSRGIGPQRRDCIAGRSQDLHWHGHSVLRIVKTMRRSRVKRGNLHPEQHQIGIRTASAAQGGSPKYAGRWLEHVGNHMSRGMIARPGRASARVYRIRPIDLPCISAFVLRQTPGRAANSP